MSMPAACVTRATIAGVRRTADIVPMVGNSLNVGVRVRIEVLACLPLIPGALNHVIQVRNDAGRTERLAVIVEINTPRIAGAFGKDLELVALRMKSPDARVKGHALSLRRARLADVRMREHTV